MVHQGSQFPSLHWNVNICQRALVLAAAPYHPSFPIHHPSPRPLSSSFPSSVESGRTRTGVLWAAVLKQEGESSRWSWAPCGLQVSPEWEGSRTGDWHSLSSCTGMTGVQWMTFSSLQPPGKPWGRWQGWDWCLLSYCVDSSEFPVAPKLSEKLQRQQFLWIQSQKTLVWVGRRAEIHHEGLFQLVH